MKIKLLRSAIFLSILLPLAFASPLTFAKPFADFSHQGEGDDLKFKSSGNTASFFSLSSDIEIKFSTTILSLPKYFYSNQPAVFNMTSSVTKKSGVPGSTGTITQDLNFLSMSFKNQAGQNLLSMMLTSLNPTYPVTLSGAQGTDALALVAGQPRHNVVFSSDFLSFKSSSRNSVSLAFNLAPTDDGLTIADDGFFSDFEATASGNFSSVTMPTGMTFPIPEPKTYIQLLGGLGLLSFMTRRLKLRA